jgi:hypothetical protein
MTSQNLRTRPFQHLRVLDRLLRGQKDTEFSGDRDREVSCVCTA